MYAYIYDTYIYLYIGHSIHPTFFLFKISKNFRKCLNSQKNVFDKKNDLPRQFFQKIIYDIYICMI